MQQRGEWQQSMGRRPYAAPILLIRGASNASVFVKDLDIALHCSIADAMRATAEALS